MSVEFFDRHNGRWYHVERRTILWVDNSPVTLDIATDVSAEREAANTARQRDELLQHTARLASLAEFASGIAHELNQPLAAIANYSAAAASFMDSAPIQMGKVREAVRRMGDESRRAGKIIHSMRGFIQKRANPHDIHNLYALLAEPLALLAPLAQRMQVEIAVDAEEREIAIECDAVMIEQVLFNLIRNALEAVAGQGLSERRETVRVGIERDGDSVIVSVSDHGPGLSDPEKLFQPFYTTKSDGMGLGLAICRTVIESHGGRLWGEANQGGGARFNFRLRCAVPL
jgi:two-component system, LuxR family, sensor histidine kinase DctS